MQDATQMLWLQQLPANGAQSLVLPAWMADGGRC